jgi:tetratricopeptide (TPR) repeat protein
MAQFREALHQERLVTPEGQSAYDIYLQLKNDPGIKPEKLQELVSEAIPRLVEVQRSVFQKWRDESKLDPRFHRWAEFCRLLEWLSTLDATYVPEYYYCQGQAAFEAGDYDRALTAFQQALQRRPNWALALNGIGRCYVRKKDWSQAERYYRQAAAADPAWVYPVANLAGVYWQTKRYAEAEQTYRQALQLAPTKPYLHYSLGHVYLQTRRRPQACAAFQNALKYSQDPPGQRPEDLGFDPEELRRQMSRWGCY